MTATALGNRVCALLYTFVCVCVCVQVYVSVFMLVGVCSNGGLCFASFSFLLSSIPSCVHRKCQQQPSA